MIHLHIFTKNLHIMMKGSGSGKHHHDLEACVNSLLHLKHSSLLPCQSPSWYSQFLPPQLSLEDMDCPLVCNKVLRNIFQWIVFHHTWTVSLAWWTASARATLWRWHPAHLDKEGPHQWSPGNTNKNHRVQCLGLTVASFRADLCTVANFATKQTLGKVSMFAMFDVC